MHPSIQILLSAMLVTGAFALNANAQSTATADAKSAAAPSAPASLFVYFDSGSASVRQQDLAILDQASRLYREGKPIVMVVSGNADASGPANVNLKLSERRANSVLQGLVSRGIPLERFQVVAKGQTDPAVPTAPGVSEERNRRVEITWR